jgi:hypothetical protein
MNKIWKTSSKNFPLDIHMELLKAAYDCERWKEFTDLLETMIIRLKYRRVEMPYLSEIDIQSSQIQYANIPNNYEKIQVDLNLNNYKRQIKKLREEGKYTKGNNNNNEQKNINEKDKDKNKNDKNNNKNNNKKHIEDNSENTNLYEKIDGMEHNFVYILVKRTHNPEKAIINFRIVMSNDNKIKNELVENERAVAIPIKTFEDNLYEDDDLSHIDINQRIKFENNKLYPYLVYKKTNNGLDNEEEKLKALVDILPLVSNSPFAYAPINYKKYDTEITIINQNINNNENKQKKYYNFNHNFINLCVKNDESFYIIDKEAEILKNLYELETSFIEKSHNDFKNLYPYDQLLMLNYSFDKLLNFSI